jgi:hypothetical protein
MEAVTNSIPSLCDSKEWSFTLRFRISHSATVWVQHTFAGVRRERHHTHIV